MSVASNPKILGCTLLRSWRRNDVFLPLRPTAFQFGRLEWCFYAVKRSHHHLDSNLEQLEWKGNSFDSVQNRLYLLNWSPLSNHYCHWLIMIREAQHDICTDPFFWVFLELIFSRCEASINEIFKPLWRGYACFKGQELGRHCPKHRKNSKFPTPTNIHPTYTQYATIPILSYKIECSVCGHFWASFAMVIC